MDVEPFAIAVSDEEINDLKTRLERTRWPDAVRDGGWDYGTNPEYLKELCRYWQTQFDWRKEERALNRVRHCRAQVEGFGLHFVHERAKNGRGLPLLLVHGYPDSFARFQKLVPLLVDGDEAFDLIVPSLPGFGFSEQPTDRGMGPAKIARLLHGLMTGLGYARYAAHGGDWGTAITEQLARLAPDALTGIHQTDVSWRRILAIDPKDLSLAEKAFLDKGRRFREMEAGYAIIQSTKPQSLAYAMTDSPAGLAGWIVEKMRAWSDCDGDVEKRFDKDAILQNVSLYWFTRTAGSAFRLYFEAMREKPSGNEPMREVPRGFAVFPKELAVAPREFAERFYDVRRWSEMPRGGHFAALEEPELLAGELRAFFHGDLHGH
jgi:pimeloyl-ACP methyl ester carboxylesterase